MELKSFTLALNTVLYYELYTYLYATLYMYNRTLTKKLLLCNIT